MRFYVLVAAIAIVVMFEESFVSAGKMDIEGLRKMILPVSKKCKKQTGVSDAMVQNTHNGEFPRDPKLMCYFKCMFIAAKAITEDGEPRIDELTKLAELVVHDDLVPQMRDVGTECYNELPKRDDLCLQVIEFVECTFIKDSSLYMLPKK